MASFAADAIDLLGDRDAAALLSDKRTRYAVIRAVEIVGEAASKVSAETRAALPDLPWREAIGMRNFLIHDYHDLDLVAVVKVVRDHLPLLVRRIEEALKEDPQ
ncbi:HepT-like ribonuclease domain-containing protein [Phenylobacterium sp.]|uniref:HepT-like ribonuclease domain-containing protein n=1 Tax=Phenylobacterium sp. TaxID=1871053 RepID=UPI00286CBDBF|nr:HepT-like ribonuclease domain-containing protein [Phenylobacterium sp.]